MFEQKPYPVWFSRRRKIYSVYCEHGYANEKANKG